MSIRSLSIATGLVIAALAAFYPGLSGGFIFDDFANLVLEPAWKVTSLNTNEWWHAIHSGQASNAGRPLAMLSFALNHYLTGLDPFWLKTTNLLLHAFNGLLVYALTLRLFVHAQLNTNSRTWAAFACAAAWLIHPLQASTTLYVVQRMEIGAATGTLLALLAYLRARESQLAGQHSALWWSLFPLACTIGIAFKENAILAPAYALLIEACILKFKNKMGATSSGLVTIYAVAAVATTIAYAYVIWPIIENNTAAYAFRDFSLTERLFTQIPILWMYLQQILLPIPDSLKFYYDNFPVSQNLLQPPQTLVALSGLVTLIFIGITTRRRWPLLALGIGWFFVGHSLTSNVWPLELAFEHRNYLPLYGIILALVQPLSTLGQYISACSRIALLTLPLATLAVLCSIQSATWGNPLHLALSLENRNPNSSRATYALGKEFFSISGGNSESPPWKKAEELFTHAAQLPPISPLPLQGLLFMYGQAGLTTSPKLWQGFRNALTQKGLNGEAIGSLYAVSDCRIRAECILDEKELLNTFLWVIQHNPNNPSVLTMYANFAWNVLKDEELAINTQRDAVKASSDQPRYKLALIKFLLASENSAHHPEAKELIRAFHKKYPNIHPALQEKHE